MRKFFVLVKKEVRELLTPQMLVPLFFTVLLFLFMGKVVGEEGKKVAANQSISVLDLDKTPTSSELITILSKSNQNVRVYKGKSLDFVIDETKANQGAIVLVVPPGFERDLDGSKLPQVEAYSILNNFSFARTQAGSITTALSPINEFLSNEAIMSEAPNKDPQKLKNPIRIKEHVVVGEKMATVGLEQVTGFVMSQTTFIPIVLFIVIILSAQMIATAIATEKENKTLETLLSTPINRSALIMAKMVAAGLMALLAAVVYLFSFRYYMEGMTGGSFTNVGGDFLGQAINELGLVLSPTSYAVLGISLFFGILCALAIAVIIGAFAEDVKSIQALIAPLMIMVFVPYILTMFLDINEMSPLLKYLILAIPFTHSFQTAPNLFFGNYPAVFYGIAYEIAFFAVFVYISSRIFSSDKILTMKLRVKKRPALKG